MQERGTISGEGIPPDEIEAEIEYPEQASIVIHSDYFQRFVKQTKLPKSYTSGEQFIHLQISDEEQSVNIETYGDNEGFLTRNNLHPISMEEFNPAEIDGIGISVPIRDVLNYLSTFDSEEIRVQWHGESDSKLASGLFITNGNIQMHSISPTVWRDGEEQPEVPEWIQEETGFINIEREEDDS